MKPLVRSPAALLGALRRLHADNEAVVFWNAEGSFKIMLRNDTTVDAVDDDDPQTMDWDLSIVWDEDDDAAAARPDIARVLDLEADGYVDEPGTFVVDGGSVSLALPADAVAGDAQLQKALAAINRLHACTVCPCGKYLVKDGNDLCVMCHLTAEPGDLRSHFCAICQTDGARRHMAPQPCCGQYLHARCLQRWETARADTGSTCPLCRSAAAL